MILPIVAIIVLNFTRSSVLITYFPLWTSGYILPIWEIFTFLLRASLTTLATLTISQNSLIQISYSLSALISACVVNVTCWKYPYEHVKYFILAEMSLVIVAGFLSYFMSFEPDQSVGGYLFSITAVAINIGFILICVNLLIPERKSSYQQPLLRSMTRESHAKIEVNEHLQVPDNSLANP